MDAPPQSQCASRSCNLRLSMEAIVLPNGTVLRTVFGGKNYHCNVDGDAIVYDGKAISPSGFVNAVGGIRRNAWNCTWILFPDTNDWKLAKTLRGDERPSRARKPAGTVKPAACAQSAPAQAHVSQSPFAPKPPVASSGVPRRQRRADTPSSLCGSLGGTERRTRTARDDRLIALFQQQLLPLLLRMCDIDDARPDKRLVAAPGRVSFAAHDRKSIVVHAAGFPLNRMPAAVPVAVPIYPGAGRRYPST